MVNDTTDSNFIMATFVIVFVFPKLQHLTLLDCIVVSMKTFVCSFESSLPAYAVR